MSITERRHGAVTILDLAGKLTLDDGVAEFRDAVHSLLDAGSRQILLNYDLSYLDTTGLRELVKASVTVRNHGGTIKIVHLTKRIGPGLDVITKLVQVYETYEDEQTALASFRGDQS